MPVRCLSRKAMALGYLLSVLLAAPHLAGAKAASTGNPTKTVGVNLAPAADFQSAWVFVDVMRTARPWLSQTSQAPSGPWNTGQQINLTTDGWPASLKPGQAASTLMCREIAGHYPAGRYVCLYDGAGTIEFGFDASVVSRVSGRIELDVVPSESGIFMTIKVTDPANPIRNIRVIMPGFEQTYAQRPFHPRFLDSLKPFSTIRFMDWGATNNSRVVTWADRTSPTRYTQQSPAGVSLELMIELCNELNADPWFCVPHAADDDYVRRMAQLIAARLEPGRKAHIEYSNEVWNSGFTQYQYAAQQAARLGLAPQTWTGVWRWTAQRSAEIFTIVEQEIAPSRLVRVLAGQAAVPAVLTEILNWKNTAAHADAIAIAPYFSGAGQDPANYPAVLGWSVDRVLDEAALHLLTVTDWITAHAAMANARGLGLLGYEGGQHLAPIGGTPAMLDPNFQVLMTKVNRHPRMRLLYYAYLLTWHESGGGAMCLFNHISEPTKWGNWGLLEYQDQPWNQAPKWRGVIEYMVNFNAMNKGNDPAVSPDIDGDGVLTTNDIRAFILLFVQQDPRADFNQDGVLDLSDVNAFISAFIAGSARHIKASNLP